MNNSIEDSDKIPQRRSNICATIGLIFSVISIFFWGMGLFGTVGLILGIVALVQLKHNQDRGRWIALIAIIIGTIWGVGMLILKAFINTDY